MIRSLSFLFAMLALGCGGALCGDGELQDGEACDDGNLRSGDACSSLCAIETCPSDSGFTLCQSDLSGVGALTSIDITDINNDNSNDIVAVNQEGELLLFVGGGTGDFGAPKKQTLGSGLQFVLPQDIDNDGFVDLVVTRNDTGEILFLGNNHDETFNVSATLPIPGAGFLRVAMSPLDGDQSPDLAIIDNAAGLLRVGFAADLFLPSDVTNLSGAADVISLDVNGDSSLDLVAGGFSDTSLAFLQNDGVGNFSRTDLTIGAGLTTLISGELDQDPQAEIVIVNFLESGVHIIDDPSNPALGPLIQTGTEPDDAVVADLDADGSAEIITANFDSTNGTDNDSITIVQDRGATSATFTIGSSPQSMATGDLNGDGRPDLAVAANGVLTIFFSN